MTIVFEQDIAIDYRDGVHLDAESADDLWTFWATATRHPVATARKLFPNRPKGYVRITRDLAAMAANLATAKDLRKRGQIGRAAVYEGIADRIYQDMRPRELVSW